MCSIETASAQTASAETSFAEPITPLKYMWDHEYLGVVHDDASHDFETHVLTQPADWYVTIMMQGADSEADEATLRAFVSPATPPDPKLHMLTEILARFVDRRMFITSPQPVYHAPEPCSLLLLCATGPCASENRVLAVCDVISRPVFQGSDDAIKHDTQAAPHEYESITQVVVRAVFPSRPSWRECVEFPLPDLDAHYQLDAIAKARFQLTIDQCLQEPPAFITQLVQRTHHSAHQAYACSVYTPHLNLINAWLASAHATYRPYARAFLLGRVLSMPCLISPRPDYEQLCAVITTGIREFWLCMRD